MPSLLDRALNARTRALAVSPPDVAKLGTDRSS
jgi:hypothetical protein